MNQVIASDQSLRLVVAIEKAIDDSRFEVCSAKLSVRAQRMIQRWV